MDPCKLAEEATSRTNSKLLIEQRKRVLCIHLAQEKKRRRKKQKERAAKAKVRGKTNTFGWRWKQLNRRVAGNGADVHAQRTPDELAEFVWRRGCNVAAGVLASNWQTHLTWLVSRSVVDTLYWTESVTMSRVDVDGEPGDVCVLMWLVVYSRPVVYATELESAFGYGNEKHRQR